jgi:hydroxylamine dehydrogenase
MEIYTESRHGLLFDAQRRLLNLEADPLKLTTRDMFVPTCATCHMSGINGLKMTHDPGERLSYWLADAISRKRPDYIHAQANMKEVCSQCHTEPLIDRVYDQAEKVVEVTNQKVQAATDLINGLRKDGVLTGKPFTQPIDFVYFDYWHYDGRTAKHGAFMGGADFVQWHGNYPLLAKMVELQKMAADLRAAHAHSR